MKIFKDVLSGDELAADAYPTRIIDDVILEVEGKRVTKTEGSDFGIASNAGDEEGATADTLESTTVTVINVVDTYRLAETAAYDKKTYLAWLKGYLGRLNKHLSATDPSRVAAFQKGCQDWAKKFLNQINDVAAWYTGASMSEEGMVIPMLYREDGLTPYFLLFKDGIVEEKI